MTTEEAIERIKARSNKLALDNEDLTALQVLGLVDAESKDERIRKAALEGIEYLEHKLGWDFIGDTDILDVKEYLERQKEQAFTHHKIDESLRDAVTHQMEDDGDVDDFVRRGIDDIVLKYAELGARWQKEQKSVESTSQLAVQGKGVYKICPHCKERMVRDDSKVYTSMPPQYGYNCPKCGTMEFDTVMYDNPEMEEQKPEEWSEEDETCLEYALWCVTKTRCCVAKDACDLDACRCAERWLESLRSKPHWKPSEEQMDALSDAYVDASTFKKGDILKSLYNDLSKL